MYSVCGSNSDIFTLKTTQSFDRGQALPHGPGQHRAKPPSHFDNVEAHYAMVCAPHTQEPLPKSIHVSITPFTHRFSSSFCSFSSRELGSECLLPCSVHICEASLTVSFTDCSLSHFSSLNSSDSAMAIGSWLLCSSCIPSGRNGLKLAKVDASRTFDRMIS